MTDHDRPDPASDAAKHFPVFELAGTPADIGRAYGRLAGEYVHRSVGIYRAALAQKGVSWERARQIARDFAPQIERYAPSFLQEMTAIAAGAELSVEDVVAINARTELLYGQRPAVPQAADDDPDGCTGAIAMPEATGNGHTLHGQNWDWRDECADSAVVLRVQPDEGPRMLIFVEAGILARCGLNSAGIALTGNFLQTEHDYGNPGVPIPLIRRRILMSTTLAEAMRVVFAAPRAFSANMMISQADGECVDLEATPVEVFWALPDRGLLVHANHFSTAAARAKLRDVGLATNTDSLYRERRVHAHLSQRLGELSVEDFKTALADHYGAPRAVCRSPITGPGGKTSSTVATILMDTSARSMWVARRPYQPHEFREYRLD